MSYTLSLNIVQCAQPFAEKYKSSGARVYVSECALRSRSRSRGGDNDDSFALRERETREARDMAQIKTKYNFERNLHFKLDCVDFMMKNP